MLLLFFGPSCSGKSSTADIVASRIGAQVWTGRDYLRLATQEPDAWKAFIEMMKKAAAEKSHEKGSLIYVTTESPAPIPELSTMSQVYTIRFTADLTTLTLRFAPRTGGQVPAPVVTMLERTKQVTDSAQCDLSIDSTNREPEEIVGELNDQHVKLVKF
jgi:predicted kinase